MCEQLLDAYSSSSSESVRNIDPKKIQLARSKLQNVNESMIYTNTSCLVYNMCSSAAQPSPNTVTDPPSVPYIYSQTPDEAENQHNADNENIVSNNQSTVLVKRKFDEETTDVQANK